jgi:FkbM family methyltransferase
VTFTSYSQNFEDVLLWRALGHVERGRYLDIGAQDPEVDSVSLSFYERGWRGLHVEPTTEFAEKLRLARPDETVIQAAVTTASGPISFYEFSGTGLSTGKADIADAHRDEGFEGRVSLVPTITLSSLLEQAPLFHWLKIDVEGMEADVLASWGDHPSRPWVVLVEATYPGKEVHTDQLWRPEMVSRDYDEVYFDGLSRYFVHRSQAGLKDAFSIPPNVFDRFAVNTNHFVAGQMRAQADEARRRDAELTKSVGSLE